MGSTLKKSMTAIIAGVACGLILAMLSFNGTMVFGMFFTREITSLLVYSYQIIPLLIETFPNMPMDVFIPYTADLLLVCCGGLTFFIAGMLAQKLNSENISGISDVALTGVLAGLTAEIIHRPFALLFDAFTHLSTGVNTSSFYGYELWIIIAVVTLMLGVLLSVLGALVYYSLYMRGHFS